MPGGTTDVTLAVNVGSSSLKLALFTFESDPRLVARESIESGSDRLSHIVAWADAKRRGMNVVAIGHRIVHGGPTHRDPQRITASLLDDLKSLVPFAPNHLPDEIGVIEALQHHDPSIAQVACFDTAFHHTMPDVARRLPIPASYDARGVRRYGFHGLSYEYLVEELERIAGPAAARSRVVLAHLGNGSSLAAVHDGASIDTTMGFTPIGGVVMSTRAGDLDPGVVTYLGRAEHLSPDDLEALLSQRSGLIGVSEVTSDMRTLLDREKTDPRCRLAVEMYVYSVAKAIGALAAALGGVDVVVFSGGIGEHAAPIRGRVCERLGFLGVHLDPELNATNAPVISSSRAAVTVRVIATDEERTIVRAAYRLLAST